MLDAAPGPQWMHDAMGKLWLAEETVAPPEMTAGLCEAQAPPGAGGQEPSHGKKKKKKSKAARAASADAAAAENAAPASAACEEGGSVEGRGAEAPLDATPAGGGAGPAPWETMDAAGRRLRVGRNTASPPDGAEPSAAGPSCPCSADMPPQLFPLPRHPAAAQQQGGGGDTDSTKAAVPPLIHRGAPPPQQWQPPLQHHHGFVFGDGHGEPSRPACPFPACPSFIFVHGLLTLAPARRPAPAQPP